MELVAVLLRVASLISGACRNVEKLPAALISGGLVEAAIALALAVFRAPSGIFVHAAFLYYAILGAIVVFGIIQAYTGMYVAGNPNDRRAIGKTILWISVLPVVLVLGLGLGGFITLK
ncbi:hypothetical protein ACP4OV_026345 [Aristida adscensionis]